MAVCKHLRSYAIVLVILFALGCGEDENDGPVFNPNNTSNNTNNANNGDDMGMGSDMSVTDAGDETDMGAAAICGDGLEECMQGFKCVRGDCVLESAQLACDEFDDLGELAADGNATASGDTSEFVDTQDASCVEVVDGFSGPENAFRFTVAARALVTIELTSTSTNLNWAFSVNRGTCLGGDEVVCTFATDTQFIATPGEDYFVIVQPEDGVDTGTFELSISLTPSACSPPGERTCNGDMVEICGQQGSFACPAGCDAGSCAGDSCDDPLEITAATTLTGSTRAIRGTYNFMSEATCDSLDTPGQDLVISLPGLTVGQVISIDASENDDLDHAIFITDSCAAGATCLSSIDLGDTLEYTVETAGDHFAFIDKLSGSNGDYQISVDIRDN